MVDIKRLSKKFQEAVRIPSPTYKERKFADWVIKELASLGIKAQEDNAGKKIGGNCGNLLARFPGDTKKAAVLLCAHMDTVETGAGIKPRVVDGTIYSSGDTNLGADDKASVAAILEVVRTIKEGKLPHPPLEILFTVAEETGLNGAKQFDYKKLKAKACFVADANGPVGGVIIKAPAYDALQATITGKAAHAGANPEEGINAVQIAAKAIAKMKLGRLDENTTANIGIVKGGTARNVVPDNCYIEGEARSHNEAALKRQIDHMTECLKSETVRGAKVKIEVERQFEAFSAAKNSLPVRLAQRAADKLGLPFSTRATGGGADTSIIAAAGIPAVTLNAGYQYPHSVDEFISLEQLRLLAEYILAIVQEA